MPDSSAGEAAFLGGEEIVNNARTLAYMENGYGPPSLTVDGGCSCSNILSLIACPGVTGYTIPAGDGPLHVNAAPWYDSAVPESGDFAGLYVTEFEGMSSTYTRDNIPRISFGSVLGRQRANERQLTWRGYLFGRTCCSVQYGLRWLTSQLAGIPCGCDTDNLDLLVCCPEVTGVGVNTVTCVGLPSVGAPKECVTDDTTVNFGPFRTLKEVALLSGPTVVSERKVGCGGGCGNTNCAAESCIIEVEFALVAGNPFFHGCKVTVCKDLVWPAPPAVCQTFTDKPAECAPCATVEDCTDNQGLCPTPEFPPVPDFIDSCSCDPIEPVELCCSIPDDAFGEFFEGTLSLEIYAGSKAMQSTIINIYQNPIEFPCDDLDKECSKCETLTIRYIPAYSTLRIDGSNKTILLDCPGNPGVTAEHLVSSPFSFPSFRCMNYCLCLITEGQVLAPDATVSVYIEPRQM